MTKSEATKLSEEMVKDLGEGWVADPWNSTWGCNDNTWEGSAKKNIVSVSLTAYTRNNIAGIYVARAPFNFEGYEEIGFAQYGESPSAAYKLLLDKVNNSLEQLQAFAKSL